jgi:hypothetical protein
VPILRNARHEKFAQELAQGRSASEAYVNAGFRASRQNAGRLRTKDDVSARVREIQGVGAASAEVSIASLLDELEAARVKATSLGQLSAAVRASVEKGRIAGLVVERQAIEVAHSDNRHDDPPPEVILARICEELGSEFARAVAERYGLEFDEQAIEAARRTANGPQGGHSQQAIEWTSPKKPAKREI